MESEVFFDTFPLFISSKLVLDLYYFRKKSLIRVIFCFLYVGHDWNDALSRFLLKVNVSLASRKNVQKEIKSISWELGGKKKVRGAKRGKRGPWKVHIK